MTTIFAFIVCFILLITSVFKGIFVAYPLMIGLSIFILLAVHKGFKLKDVLIMAYKGGKKSYIVLEIFILIGVITSTWMAAGTVPAIVYYGVKYLNPNLFILSAFLICSAVSFLIGTSFGTVGTVGVALMVMARGGSVNSNIVAGAILAGAYFGDRCSPMSSSANLIATLTKTDIYINIKNMLKTGAVPLIISMGIYGVLSFKYPLHTVGNGMAEEISKVFSTSYLVLLPALVILIFSFFKVPVKRSILISSIIAIVLAVFVQHRGLLKIMEYIIAGYSIENDSPLKAIIKGGGVLSMLKVALVVFISSAFTGIFEETGMLNQVDQFIGRAEGRGQVMFTTTIVSIASAAFGCTQVLAVILTHILTKKIYVENKIEDTEFAVDIENTAIVISPLIPWNIAVLVPLTTLMVGVEAIPYAFYLYLLPIVNIAYLNIGKKVALNRTKSC